MGSTRCSLGLRAPGRFRLEDVPAGVYQLHVAFAEERADGSETPQRTWSLRREVTVPKARNDEPLDLGTLELTVKE